MCVCANKATLKLLFELLNKHTWTNLHTLRIFQQANWTNQRRRKKQPARILCTIYTDTYTQLVYQTYSNTCKTKNVTIILKWYLARRIGTNLKWHTTKTGQKSYGKITAIIRIFEGNIVDSSSFYTQTALCVAQACTGWIRVDAGTKWHCVDFRLVQNDENSLI